MKQNKNNEFNNSNNINKYQNNIEIIDFGIAFKIRNTIYLNRNLEKYPELRKAIIKHEKAHTNNKNYTLSDVWIDLNGKYLKKVKKQYYKFLFTEKRAWYQFLPVLKVHGKWLIDFIMLFFWIIIIMLFIGIINIL